MENRIHPPHQMPGHHGLCYPIGDSGNAEHSRTTTVRLRNRHRADWRRKVRARRHPVPNLVQIVLKVLLEVVDTLTIHSCRTLVRPDLLPRLLDFPLGNIKLLALRLQLAHRTPPGEHPVDAINSVTNDPAPSLHPRYRGFTTTTSRSASMPRVGTRSLAVSSAWDTPSRPPLHGGPY